MVWLIALSLLLGPRTAHEQHPQTHKLKSATRDDKSIIPPATTPNQATATAVNSQSPSQNDSTKKQKWWQMPEWDTLLVTVLYTVVSGCALIVIWNQNRSIQNTERAVLIPLWENFVHVNPDKTNTGELSHCFKCRFRNSGQTPAFITAYYAEIKIISNFDLLPKKPCYGEPVSFQGDPIIKDGTTDREFYSPMDDDRDFEIIKREYREDGKILFAFGFVRYNDIYGRTHETRFGLKYVPDAWAYGWGWSVDGPPAYNNYS